MITVERALILALAVLSQAREETNRAPVEGTLALRACLAFIVAAAGGRDRARGHAVSFWRFVTGRNRSASGSEYQDMYDRTTGANACFDLLIEDLGWKPTREVHDVIEAMYKAPSWAGRKTHTPDGQILPEYAAWRASQEQRTGRGGERKRSGQRPIRD